MCYLIYARLPINAQRLDKTLLPMFMGKLADLPCGGHLPLPSRAAMAQ